MSALKHKGVVGGEMYDEEEYGGYYGQEAAEGDPYYDNERMEAFTNRMYDSAAAPGVTPGGNNKASAAPANAQSAVVKNAPKTVVVGTPIAHKWSAPTMHSEASAGSGGEKKTTRYVHGGSNGHANGDVIKKSNRAIDAATKTFTPLETALKVHNLSVDEHFNVESLHVGSAVNNSDHPIRVQIKGVNGEDIKRNVHSDGSWSTLTLAPNEHLNYSSLNDGKGLFLSGQKLDPAASLNVMSKSDLLSHARVYDNKLDETGQPESYLVDLDLGHFVKNSSAVADSDSITHNQLGDIIFTNAFPSLNKQEPLQKALDKNKLREYRDLTNDLLPSAVIAPKPFETKPGQFTVKVNGGELRKLVEDFKKNNMADAQRTVAKNQTVTFSRLDAKEKPVQPGDVHVQLNWELQHNGEPHVKI